MSIKKAINTLKSMAEEAGAVVVNGPVPTGFLCMHSEGPIIGLPDADPPERTVLVLAHELGHLLSGHQARQERPSWEAQEKDADRFAFEKLHELLSPRHLKKVFASQTA